MLAKADSDVARMEREAREIDEILKTIREQRAIVTRSLAELDAALALAPEGDL